jgi:aminoglycoside 6'-N-acetyltransferase
MGGGAPYSFRPFTRADLVLAARWLETPEVVRWWGNPDEQLALLTEDLDEPKMRQWIAEHDGRAFAYVQAYEAHAWPQPHLAHLPGGAQVIDAFIGEPGMIGRGHGGAFLRQLAELLIAEGAPGVAIDPDAANIRARRAYASAGFVEQGIVETTDGRAALMIFSGAYPGCADST